MSPNAERLHLDALAARGCPALKQERRWPWLLRSTVTAGGVPVTGRANAAWLLGLLPAGPRDVRPDDARVLGARARRGRQRAGLSWDAAS